MTNALLIHTKILTLYFRIRIYFIMFTSRAEWLERWGCRILELHVQIQVPLGGRCGWGEKDRARRGQSNIRWTQVKAGCENVLPEDSRLVGVQSGGRGALWLQRAAIPDLAWWPALECWIPPGWHVDPKSVPWPLGLVSGQKWVQELWLSTYPWGSLSKGLFSERKKQFASI